jgi:putative ABC transport system ATP-binding protein
MNTAISVRQLNKSFRSGDQDIPVLKGLDLTIQEGEAFFIVGPSGCGKTTLLSLLCGTLNADDGELEVIGHNLRAMSANQLARFRARHVGFVFQQFNLIPTLTVVENTAIPLKLNGCSSSKATKAAAAALESVGLGDRLHERPDRLSGGQQQRVAIARAIAHHPDLIVCDEPTSALDSANGRQVMELLTANRRDGGTARTVIVVSHDPRIYHQADRIAVMEDGIICRTISSPDEIQHLT